MKTLTLYEANEMVRQAVEDGLPGEYWIEAELSEVRENRGHCYMELVDAQRSDRIGSLSRGRATESTPAARASAKCWASTWSLLRPHFERVTGQPMRAGMRVMLLAHAQFHELYGFSWIVSDINPEFTLGDMARKRQEVIRQLKEEGVFDLQRELQLPMFAKRIAVISAASAAGYGDFCNQLRDNAYGFAFTVELFPAVMQGEQVEPTIIAALNSINGRQDEFDAVVIIRGGGATTDLSGFDTLLLAENVANFPLPIITGIGHDRDESILDMISHMRVKTPTAAAAFLIDHLAQVAERLALFSERIPQLVAKRFVGERHRIETFGDRLNRSIQMIFERRRYQLNTIEYQIRSFDPQLILSRGYSLTMKDGKAVRDAAVLQVGDIVETRLEKGSVRSRVT